MGWWGGGLVGVSPLKANGFGGIELDKLRSLAYLFHINGLKNLKIGRKLDFGIAILVVLMFLVVGSIFVAGREATQNINLTEDVRVPAALASAQARSSLLEMQASMRGYLVLSDLNNIDTYNKATEIFEINLARLEALSVDWTNREDIRQLEALKATYETWSPISERLFLLHQDPLENQPALRIYSLEFQAENTKILHQINDLIQFQEQKESLSLADRELLADMTVLDTSFQSMATNLRAYVTSGDVTFKSGYAKSLDANTVAWRNVLARQSGLEQEQQALLTAIAETRSQLLLFPLQIFKAVEGRRTYEDLYLFKTEVEPQAKQMLQLLNEMTVAQQTLLQTDLNTGRQSLNLAQRQTLMGGLLALILGSVMAYLFRGNIVKPIQRLINTAEQITAGDFTAQAQVESQDEIGQLAATLNTMTGRLRETIEAAEQASRAKSEFLTNMSHELRTPLHSILGYAQILKRDKNLHASHINAVSVIQESGEHLLTLINDILDISKIEARKLELYPTDFDFPDFMEGIAGMFQIRAQQKPDVTFAYQRLTVLPSTVHADEKRLRQVLINLLSNAFKFTDKGGVTLRVWIRKQGVWRKKDATHASRRLAVLHFEVEDTGIGIATEQLENIFLPFEQVGDFRRRAEGTGLGLTITKNLVETMGGTLTVQSGLGQGSIFRLDLEFPVIRSMSESRLIPEHDIEGYKGLRRKILVVDNDAHNRSMLADLLEPLGFEVIKVKSGQESITVAPAIRPDLILMDLVMPEMSGIEAVKAIRQLAELRHKRVVIIATSARVFEEAQLQSKLVGCDDFLAKPIAVERLLKAIETQLSLEWKYSQSPDKEESGAQETFKDETELLFPPSLEELDVLFDLAMKGDLSTLRKRAIQIKNRDEKFNPFSQKLCQLIDDVAEDEILALLERLLAQNRT